MGGPYYDRRCDIHYYSHDYNRSLNCSWQTVIKDKAMIKLIFTLLFVVSVTVSVNAQIDQVFDGPTETVLGEHKVGRYLLLQLEYVEPADSEREPYYRLTYRDYRYFDLGQYESVIIDNNQTLSDLRDIIMEYFSLEETKYEKSFMLGEVYTTVSGVRLAGVRSVRMYFAGAGYTQALTRRQWDRFFSNIDK
jgi:hypothetical protein